MAEGLRQIECGMPAPAAKELKTGRSTGSTGEGIGESMDCPFCDLDLNDRQEIILENEFC
jgi:hypothetical protein